MIAIIPFILLWVRMAKFCKLTTADLPDATQNDIDQMHKASKTAFKIMLGFTILSLLPYGFVPSEPVPAFSTESTIQAYNSANKIANILSIALGVGGLLAAAMFDLKAERIKKRFRVQAPTSETSSAESDAILIEKRHCAQAVTAETSSVESGTIQWYHVVIAILLPYIGLPWGIINLVKKRRDSGLLMTIVSGILLLILVIANIN